MVPFAKFPFEALVGNGGIGGVGGGSDPGADTVLESLFDASERDRPIRDLTDFFPRRVHPVSSFFSFGAGERGESVVAFGVVGGRELASGGGETGTVTGGEGSSTARNVNGGSGLGSADGIGSSGSWIKSSASNASPRPFAAGSGGTGGMGSPGAQFEGWPGTEEDSELVDARPPA